MPGKCIKVDIHIVCQENIVLHLVTDPGQIYTKIFKPCRVKKVEKLFT